MRLNLLIFGASMFHDKSFGSNATLTLGEKPTLRWALRHESWGRETDEHGKEPFKEEDITPCVEDH